ncbi:MAG: hypothetical protein KTM48_03595, partial [Wolbachia endosymbiont of Pissodes strobi]|nr:hypothetical protein [Wolbachia endosymbiont of Pissodes strobi]
AIKKERDKSPVTKVLTSKLKHTSNTISLHKRSIKMESSLIKKLEAENLELRKTIHKLRSDSTKNNQLVQEQSAQISQLLAKLHELSTKIESMSTHLNVPQDTHTHTHTHTQQTSTQNR